MAGKPKHIGWRTVCSVRAKDNIRLAGAVGTDFELAEGRSVTFSKVAILGHSYVRYLGTDLRPIAFENEGNVSSFIINKYCVPGATVSSL